VQYANHLYAMLGVEPRAELSTRPEKRLGTEKQWDQAEAALEQALQRHGMEYVISPGEGTFYGPKIDLHMTDSLDRSWQMGTIQLDYQMPAGFGLSYVGADGEDHPPVVIHRALLGSLERFIGILTEHYAGAFPAWLSPVQVIGIPVTDALAQCTSESVLVALVRNATAKISGATYKSLVEKSRALTGLQEPLARRAALPPMLANAMCAWVSDALKSYIETNYKLPPETLDAALEKTIEKARMAAKCVRKDPSHRAKLATGAYALNRVRAHVLAPRAAQSWLAGIATSTRVPAPVARVARRLVLDGVYVDELERALR